MRTTCGVLLLLLNCVTGIALAAQLEVGVDRPGGDYRVIELPAPNPQLCAAQCEQDGRCLAFSYVKPGVQAPNARCWLKDELRTPVRGNPAAISGVMRGGAQPQRNPNYEYDTDRPGSDYANFDLQAANPDLCAAACTQDGRCRAWTYVRPGAQGPNPRCWLKSQVPNPVQSVFKAISGVKRTAGAAPPTTAGNLPPVVGTPPTSGPGAPQRPPGQGGQGGQGQGQPPVTTPPSTRPGGTGTFPPPGPTPGPTVSPGQAVYVLQGVRVSDPYQNIKRFVRVDDMKYDTRGGEVRVTGCVAAVSIYMAIQRGRARPEARADRPDEHGDRWRQAPLPAAESAHDHAIGRQPAFPEQRPAFVLRSSGRAVSRGRAQAVSSALQSATTRKDRALPCHGDRA